MAYQTGVSSSVGDLMSALFNFAGTMGFTSGGSWTTGSDTVWSLSKGGAHYTFQFSNANVLLMNTATALVGSGVITTQTGACPNSSRVYPISGPHVGYHFFSDGNVIHAVVELVTNVFQHFSFGQIQKAGIWVGGNYVTGNYWNMSVQSNGQLYPWSSNYYHDRLFEKGSGYYANCGHVRVTYEEATIATFGNLQTGTTLAKCSPWDWGYELIEDSPNSFNSRAALVPVEIILSSQYRNTSPAHWMQLGHIPTAASVNIANLNPKEMVNNDWMVFPLSQKNGPNTTYVNTGNVGMAYRK